METFGFLLKKVLGAALMPLPLFLLLLLLAWLLKRRAWPRSGRVLTAAAFALLLLASLPVSSRWLVSLLERRHPPIFDVAATGIAPRSVVAVVVLGGGHRDDRGLPPTSRLPRGAVVRLAEGVRLWRQVPHARLILTGTVEPGGRRGPEEMAGLARAMGVPAGRLMVEGASYDTVDHAANLKATLAGAPFVLVTSALHMARALRLFRAQGLQPLPAPTDHAGGGGGGSQRWDDFVPKASALDRSRQAWHEVLGGLWDGLRGVP